MNYYFSDFDLSQFFTPLYIFPILICRNFERNGLKIKKENCDKSKK